MKIIMAVLVAATIAAIAWAASCNDRKTLELATSGKAVLYCFMIDGWRKIDAKKITDFSDGRWYFTNGSASSCKFMEANQ